MFTSSNPRALTDGDIRRLWIAQAAYNISFVSFLIDKEMKDISGMQSHLKAMSEQANKIAEISAGIGRP